MLYLGNADVEAVLDMPACLDALRTGYADLGCGDAAYRHDIYAPTGRTEDYYRWGSMSGVCRAQGVVAIRIKSDVVYWPDGKTEEKLLPLPGRAALRADRAGGRRVRARRPVQLPRGIRVHTARWPARCGGRQRAHPGR